MLLAAKGNREMRISPDDKEKYLDAGYSLYEKKDGEITKIKPPVKKTPEIIALEKENAALKERLASLEPEPEEKPATKGRGK